MNKIIIVLMLSMSALFVHGQEWNSIEDSAVYYYNDTLQSHVDSMSYIRLEYFEDSCAWETVVDTINVEWVIIVEEGTNYLKKVVTPYIIKIYEKYNCLYLYSRERRNEKYFVKGKEADIFYIQNKSAWLR